MGENQKKILEMLAAGKITVEEATRLLSLVDKDDNVKQDTARGAKSNARYLYVKVEPKAGCETKDNPKVNVRVPVSLIRAGMKLRSLIPNSAADDINRGLRDKGISFDIRNLKDADLEELVDALRDTEIDVDSVEASVKIHAE